MQQLGREGMYAGVNSRWATTSGLCWPAPDLIVATNLLGNSVNLYKVVDHGESLSVEPSGPALYLKDVTEPSMVAVSPDGQWLAVTNACTGSVTLFSIEKDWTELRSHGCHTLPGRTYMHGVAFSADSRHIICLAIDDPGCIDVLRIEPADSGYGAVSLVPVNRIETGYGPLKPKGVSFAPNGLFVAISYGANATAYARNLRGGFVELCAFDPAAGAIGSAVSRSNQLANIDCAEDVTFFPDGRHVLVTDNFADHACVLAVDTESGTLGPEVLRIGRAAGGLRSPHGCAVSPDGTWFAITNYGDATIRFFRAPSQVATSNV